MILGTTGHYWGLLGLLARCPGACRFRLKLLGLACFHRTTVLYLMRLNDRSHSASVDACLVEPSFYTNIGRGIWEDQQIVELPGCPSSIMTLAIPTIDFARVADSAEAVAQELLQACADWGSPHASLA